MRTSVGDYLRTAGEIFAVLAPIVCLFDCVVLPIAAALLPLFGHHLLHGVQDQVIALAVLGICGPIILPGFAQHRNMSVLIMFAIGSSLMIFVNFVGVADQLFHLGMSLIASCLLIKANLDNKRLLACPCHHHAHNDHH